MQPLVSLLRGAQLGGGDATAAFNKARHSTAARLKLYDYDIGAVTDLPKLRLAAKRYLRQLRHYFARFLTRSHPDRPTRAV